MTLAAFPIALLLLLFSAVPARAEGSAGTGFKPSLVDPSTQGSPSKEQSEAMRWLEKIVEARRSISYEGRFVFLHGDRIVTMQVEHRAGPNGVRERLVALDGARREVLRDGDRVTCLMPHEQKLVVRRGRASRRWPPDDPSRLRRLPGLYDISLAAAERVADRDTQRIDVHSRRNHRYDYRLWVDKGTGLVLKSEILTPAGKLLEQMVFTEIRMLDSRSGPGVAVAPQGDSGEVGRVGGKQGPGAEDGATEADTLVGASQPALAGSESGEARAREETRSVFGNVSPPGPWRVESVPEGFGLQEYERRRMPGSDSHVDHLVFSDGMTAVSVFVEPLEGDRGMTELMRRGTVNVYGRTVGGYQIVVVGEVPPETVRMIGDSVRRDD
jgi:sigma-E factor negative regulatory protein RseB